MDFSTELLHCVFSFCSRRDLVTLSQVNSTFQQAAEYLLYRHIHSSVYLDYDIESQKRLRVYESLFRILASNPQKAALLRSLHIQLEFKLAELYAGTWIVDDDSTIGLISGVLRNAHGLLDLRIGVGHTDSLNNAKFNEVIRSCHFQLHTLYIYSLWDLKGIIANQKHLRLLGIYYSEYPEISAELIDHLYHTGRIDGNRKLPEIFLFSTELTKISQLILFPELYLPGQAFSVCKHIATSLDRDLCNSSEISWGPYSKDCRFAIHVFDFTHAKATICEMVEAMAQYFSGCQLFAMLAQPSGVQGTVWKPWRIPGISTSISRFKQLHRLDFYLSGDSSDPFLQVATDLRSFVLEELVPACPTLMEIQVVYNYSEYAYLACSSDWTPRILGFG